MKYKQFDIWLTDLNPQFGTEAGKTRPVLIVQSNLLNKVHNSTIVCPITSKVKKDVSMLRINLLAKNSGLSKKSAVMIDQIRAVDNKRFIKKMGTLPDDLRQKVKDNIKIVMDLEA